MKVGQEAVKQGLRQMFRTDPKRGMAEQRAGERTDFSPASAGVLDASGSITPEAFADLMSRQGTGFSLPAATTSPFEASIQRSLGDSFLSDTGEGLPEGSFLNAPSEGVPSAPSTPGAAGGMGFNPSLGASLGAAGGAYGLYQGLKNKKPLQAAAGGLSVGQSAASMAGLPAVSGAIGSVAGPLGLYQGIKTKDPVGITTGALGTYNSLAALSSAYPSLFGGTSLPSLGSLAGQGLSYIAPDLAASLGIGSTAGGGATAAGLGAGSAAAGGSATTGASAGGLAAGETLGATGSTLGTTAAGAGGTIAGAAGMLAVPAAIGFGIWSKAEADQMESIMRGAKETMARRGALPQNIDEVMNAFTTLQDDPSQLSDQDLGARFESLKAALPAMNNVHALINAPSSAPSRIPRMDTTELKSLADVYSRTVPFGLAAYQDEFAKRGAPMDQYFKPLSDTDFMSLAGDVDVTPEQLAGIGPGNMLAALQAVRSGQPLANLPQVQPGVGEARLKAAQGDIPYESGMQYAPYFLNAEQRAMLSERQKAYPGEMAAREGDSQNTSLPPQTPFQLWQELLGGYQVPQAPQGMFAPPQAAAGMGQQPEGGMGVAPGASGEMDPGVSIGGAGKRSPVFPTPELDNRAEAGAGKVMGAGAQDVDMGVPFGMAGKRQGPRGGMGIAPQPRPGGGRPGGQAPFGGVPRGGMMPQASGGRPQLNQQRRTSGVV